MKWLQSKKIRTAGLCAALAALMFSAVNFLPAAVGAASTNRQLPIYCVQRDQKMVSLSFDAAWGDVRVRHSNCKNPAFISMPKHRFSSDENRCFLTVFNNIKTA